MRREAPPERITAASMILPCAYGGARVRDHFFHVHFFVRGGGGVAAHGDQFRDDADGNFFRGEGADFEAHGRVDALEFFGAVAILFERFVDGEHFAFAADHADIARFGAHGPGEHAHVFFVAASDDDEVGGGVGLNLFKGLLVAGENILGHGEALEIGEGFAVVDDADGETGGACGSGQGHGDVAAAEEIDDGLREDRLDENLDGAAADQSIVVAGFVVEIENHFARRFFLHDFFGRSPNIGFDAAATDGADQGTIFANEHARTFVTGDGAVGVHDGGEGAALPGSPHFYDLFKKVHGDQQFTLRRAWGGVNVALPKSGRLKR